MRRVAGILPLQRAQQFLADAVIVRMAEGAQAGRVQGFDAAMATLVRSVMLGMKHAAPILMKQGSGSIINNGSIAGRRAGYSTSMIYGAAKAAVNHLTVCAAMQLGEKNVRCNSISPGGIATGIFAKALGVEPSKADSYAEEAKKMMATMQPIPRAGMPEDIARARKLEKAYAEAEAKGLGAINVDGIMVDVASIRLLRNTILNKADLFGM